MQPLREAVDRSCRRRRLFEPGTRVLIAVSGGPDSVALLHVLLELRPGLELGGLGVAHLDHGIRGEAARADAAWVADLAAQLALPYHTARVDVPDLARLRGTSLEDAARQERYSFLTGVAARCGYDRIATGHTSDDQAETVLLALVRGAGRTGLGGMSPLEGIVARPMLEVTREQVVNYLAQHRLQYRTDATNDDQAYMRNRIRHRLMPLLAESFNPQIVAALNRSAVIMDEEDRWLDDLARIFLREAAVFDRPGRSCRLDRTALTAAPRALARRALRLTAVMVSGELPCPLDFEHVESVLTLLEGRTGAALRLPAGLEARLGYRHLTLRLIEPGEGDHGGPASGHNGQAAAVSLVIPGEIDCPEMGLTLRAEVVAATAAGEAAAGGGLGRWRTDSTSRGWSCLAYLSLDALALPLAIRARRRGDRFWPQGWPAEGKLKDFLIGAKVERCRRRRLPLVVDASGRIAAVLPLRAAAWAVVTESSAAVLRLEARQQH